MANSPEVNFTIYVYEENYIVRTGFLLYYDPILMSGLYTSSLSALNTVDNTLPSSDPAGSTFPDDINANMLTITVEE